MVVTKNRRERINTYACDENYVDIKTLSVKEAEINRCLQVLNGYMNYLDKMQKSKG